MFRTSKRTVHVDHGFDVFSFRGLKDVATSINSCGNQAICSHRGVQPIPPTSWCIVQAVRRPLQRRSDRRRITGFKWQLTDHVSGRIIGLALEQSILQVHMQENQIMIRCYLTCHSESRSSRRRRNCLLFQCLPILKTLEKPSGLLYGNLHLRHVQQSGPNVP